MNYAPQKQPNSNTPKSLASPILVFQYQFYQQPPESQTSQDPLAGLTGAQEAGYARSNSNLGPLPASCAPSLIMHRQHDSSPSQAAAMAAATSSAGKRCSRLHPSTEAKAQQKRASYTVALDVSSLGDVKRYDENYVPERTVSPSRRRRARPSKEEHERRSGKLITTKEPIYHHRRRQGQGLERPSFP